MRVYQNLLLMGLGIGICCFCPAVELIIVPDPYLSEGFKSWLYELLQKQGRDRLSFHATFTSIKNKLPSAQELRLTKEPGLPAVARLRHARPFLLIHRLNTTDLILAQSGDYVDPYCYRAELIEQLPSMIVEKDDFNEKEKALLAQWAKIKPPLFFSEYVCRWINKNNIALSRAQNPLITMIVHPQKAFSPQMQEQLQSLCSEIINNNRTHELVIDTRFKNWVISKHAIKRGFQ